MNQSLVYIIGAFTLIAELAVSCFALYCILAVFRVQRPKFKNVFRLVIEPGLVALIVTAVVTVLLHVSFLSIGVAIVSYLVWFHILLKRFYSFEVQKSLAVFMFYFVVAGIFVYIIQAIFFSFFTNTTITDDSMSPTFAQNTQVLVSSIGKKYSRGDIVYFFNEDSGYLVRRIIGLPGETVEVKTGSVFINGKKLDESYITTPIYCPEPAEASGKSVSTLYGENVSANDFSNSDNVIFPNIVNADCSKPFALKDGQYFVLGDNVSNAKDSRQFGAVAGNNISGKVLGKSKWNFSF
jgi:signal peptidase I